MAEQMVRIGELARRTGVSPDVLRAWERRYGLLRPVRSPGNYRLYSSADEGRVRSMSTHLAGGVPAGEAARIVLSEPESAPAGDFRASAEHLRRALEDFDDAGSQAALDALLAAFGFETVAREVVLPYLRGLGERWRRGETTVAQEHFASVVLRGRLLGLARGWDRGSGPRALLACAPGEMHELGLIMSGSRCASTAGASPTSAPTPRSTPCRQRPRRWRRRPWLSPRSPPGASRRCARASQRSRRKRPYGWPEPVSTSRSPRAAAPVCFTAIRSKPPPNSCRRRFERV